MSLFSPELYKVEFFYLVFPPFDMNFINIYLHRDCLGLFLLNTLDIFLTRVDTHVIKGFLVNNSYLDE